MAVIGLDHVQIAIPAGGEDQARAFYAGLLGMAEVPKPANLSPSGCWFRGGSVSLHIGVDPAFCAAFKAHPAFLSTIWLVCGNGLRRRAARSVTTSRSKATRGSSPKTRSATALN